MSTIAVFGAGGRSGRALVTEARSRGHQVTAAVRDPAQHADLNGAGVTLEAADAMNPREVTVAAAGHDAAVNATRSAGDIPADYLVRMHQALLAGLAEARVPRLLIVGGAGTLEVTPGVQFVDTPEFPAATLPRGSPTARPSGSCRRAPPASTGSTSPRPRISPPTVHAPGATGLGAIRR